MSADRERQAPQWLRDGLALQPTDTVLHLCCGDGALSRALARHCRRVVAVDTPAASPAPGGSVEAPDNVEFVRLPGLDLGSLPEDGATTFDKVVTCGTLDRFSADSLRTTLQRSLRWTTAECRILLADVPLERPGTARLRGWLGVLGNRAPRGWTVEALTRVLGGCGLYSSFVERSPSAYRIDVIATRDGAPVQGPRAGR